MDKASFKYSCSHGNVQALSITKVACILLFFTGASVDYWHALPDTIYITLGSREQQNGDEPIYFLHSFQFNHISHLICCSILDH